MVLPTPESVLSPLDQIRLTEAELNRSIVAARQSAEKLLAAAEQQAVQCKRQAREAGHQDGLDAYQASMATAEEEARAITIAAQAQAQQLRSNGLASLSGGVSLALRVVVGLPEKVAQA